MSAENSKWIDWREYMPEDAANNYEFGSIPVLQKFAFLLLKQAALLERVPVSTESRRVDLARALLMGISGNAQAAVRLAKESFANEVYPILRSLVERIVTFYYLQSCDESELQDYVDYSNQKAIEGSRKQFRSMARDFLLRQLGSPI